MTTDNEFEKFLDSDDFINAGSSNGWRGVAKSAWQAAKQQPLKRLSESQINDVYNDWTSRNYMDFAKLIIDEMERINRE